VSRTSDEFAVKVAIVTGADRASAATGAQLAGSVAEVGRTANIISVMVRDDAQVIDVARKIAATGGLAGWRALSMQVEKLIQGRCSPEGGGSARKHGGMMSQPEVADWFPSEERRELGEALRRLLDVVVQTGATPAELKAAAATVDELTASLSGTVLQADRSVAAGSYRSHMSTVGGLSHPIAPQLRMDVHEGGGQGVVVIGPLFQGGPGLVHGGVLALLIDHAMGCVAAGPQRPAMTVSLTMHYRKPTPLGVPLTVAVRLDRIEGRKLLLSADITANGEVTVEAGAVFLTLTEQNLRSVFGGPLE
jgi:acyl-coenzyme A thioesterase PaaI-like protein